jgi:hypothetical protein
VITPPKGAQNNNPEDYAEKSAIKKEPLTDIANKQLLDAMNSDNARYSCTQK